MISRYNLYTALLGSVGVMFAMSAAVGAFPIELKTLLIVSGAAVFMHSAWILYRAQNSAGEPAVMKSRTEESGTISRITLLNAKGEGVMSWELYGRTSAVIGKDIDENHVDIDLSESPYVSMVEVEHAVLNYAGGNWYVEDLGSQNGVSIRKSKSENVYRLSSLEPCKLDFGDVIEIGMCQLKLN